MIELVTTYLEMKDEPKDLLPKGFFSEGFFSKDWAVRPFEKPSVGFFRYLYNAVGDGSDGYWWVRREMTDAALAQVLARPGSVFYLLSQGGNPAGFYELDLADPLNIEIAFFGIIPAFRGLSLGRWLLSHAMETAWALKPERLWLHTCNYDSPRALLSYRAAGFSVYARESQWIDLPN